MLFRSADLVGQVRRAGKEEQRILRARDRKRIGDRNFHLSSFTSNLNSPPGLLLVVARPLPSKHTFFLTESSHTRGTSPGTINRAINNYTEKNIRKN